MKGREKVEIGMTRSEKTEWNEIKDGRNQGIEDCGRVIGRHGD